MSITRRLVKQLGERIDPWPTPMADPYVEVPRQKFMAAIGLMPVRGRGDISPIDAHAAVDEWINTSDRDLLTSAQRAVNGVALLECFSKYTECNRVSPPTVLGLKLLAQGLGEFSAEAIETAGRACKAMLDRRMALSLSDDEEALLDIMYDALAGMAAKASSEPGAFDADAFERRMETVLRDTDDRERAEVCAILESLVKHRWVGSGLRAAATRVLRDLQPKQRQGTA
ncbi:MAG: hypothetical protein ACIAS6_03320 [Phycisphaerales bacterium JB060]